MGFSWSWSQLKNWRDCPKRYYHVDVLRDVKREESEQLKAGNIVHKVLEQRIGQGTVLPLAYQPYERFTVLFDQMRELGWEVAVERKLAFDRNFDSTDYHWKNQDAWYRCKVDVLAIHPNRKAAIAYDWKTGKVNQESQQLALNAQAVMVHHPYVERVSTRYVWLKDKALGTPEVYGQTELTRVWNALWPELKMLEEAHKTTSFPAKPGGLCKEYCPVTSCPHYGVGSY